MNVRLLTSDRCAGLIAGPLRDALLDGIAGARERILLCTFMALDDVLAHALREAALRGVELWLVLDRTKGQIGRARGFFGAEVSIFTNPENSGQEFALMHLKTVVIDRRHSFIGSWNLTASGMAKNLELGMVADDVELALDVEGFLEGLLHRGILARVQGT